MALFTDGNPNSIDDLRAYETSIVSVAGVEGIGLDSKLTLAADDIGAQILAFLLREWPRDPQATVGYFGYTFATSGGRRKLGLSTVAVTPPLKRWHALETLALVYRDAYNNQLNDRYRGKWQEYAKLAHAASVRYFQDGTGLVLKAIPKAAAPSLSSLAGDVPGATYFVSAAWVGATGAEGSPSDPSTLDTGSGGLLVATPPAAPAAATGWNVYAGTAVNAMTKQNSAPLGLGTPWTMTTSGLTTGAPLGSGQSPDVYLQDWHEIPRG
ncbi:MAG: hypothetical protein ACRD9L_09260 [Bryobacteraceae bacterium]